MSLAVSADKRTDAAETPVLPAIDAGTTDSTPEPSFAPMSDTLPGTQRNDANGSTDTRSESASESPTSERSAQRTSVSNRHWSKPRNVRQFVSQVNDVATALLNGNLNDEEIERLRIYAGLTRVVAQGMTTEVQRARFLKTAPDLAFEDEE